MNLVRSINLVRTYWLSAYPVAAVAAFLAQYKFTLKTSPPSPFNPTVEEPLPENLVIKPLTESKEWKDGIVYAKAQNLARTVCFFLHGSTLNHNLIHGKAHGITRQLDDTYGDSRIISPGSGHLRCTQKSAFRFSLDASNPNLLAFKM